jgi:hypothetical protein
MDQVAHGQLETGVFKLARAGGHAPSAKRA